MSVISVYFFFFFFFCVCVCVRIYVCIYSNYVYVCVFLPVLNARFVVGQYVTCECWPAPLYTGPH